MPVVIGLLVLAILLWVFWLPSLIAGIATFIVYLAKRRYQFQVHLAVIAVPVFLLTWLGQVTANNITRAQNEQAAAIARSTNERNAAIAARAAHEKRAAWNKAHPAEVAARRKAARDAAARQYAASVAAASAAQAAAAAANKREAQLENARSTEGERACDSMNSAAPGSVQNCHLLDDHSLIITIDADGYNAFSTQDQKLIRAGFFDKWFAIWQADHPDNKDAADVYLGIKDLTGAELGYFTLANAQPGF